MLKRAWGSGVAVAAALALVPSVVFADQAPPFSGKASTATLSVSIDPTALLSLQSVPSQVSSVLTTALQPITVQVDSGHASGTRSTTATDLSAGHADVTPVSLDLSQVATLLGEVQTSLSDLSQGIVLAALQSTLANVATITGDQTVMALLPSALATDLQALNTQLSQLVTQLAALPGQVSAPVSALTSTLTQQLGSSLKLAVGLAADLDSAHPNGQNTTQPAITVPQAVTLPSLVPTQPVVAALSPFDATAVNAAGAQSFGVSGPQASSNESADGITISPAMDLSVLGGDVSALQGTMQQVLSSIGTIAPLLSASAALIDQALPGGLDLTTLEGQVTTVLPLAQTLFDFVNGLQLNGVMVCNALGTGSCSIASTSVAPKGSGMESVASSKLVGLSILPMSQDLASALAPLGATAGAPLLDVEGLQATADTLIDATGGSQTASGQVTTIKVAGQSVVSSGAIDKTALTGHLCGGASAAALPDSLPVGVPTDICMAAPTGDVTVAITVGAPQFTYTGATHRSASLAKMEIRLINGAPDGSNPVTVMGANKGGTISTVDVGSVSSEVLGTAASGGTSASPSPTPGPLVATSNDGNNVTMEKTGMFGPGSLLAGFGLLGAGVAMRFGSRRRRRRSA